MQSRNLLARYSGLALAVTGATHFAVPQLWEPITKPVFGRDTRRHVYIDGGIETLLGLGLSARQTRAAAIVGLIGYSAYLAGNAIRNQTT